MELFEVLAADGHEQLVLCHDPGTSLRAAIAVHSTALGPALGGTRFYPYSSESDAVRDVLRLAKGMTYKAAAAGLDLGGGKAVIIGDPRAVRSEALLRAYARFVDGLGGRYLTAEDVGTTQADMDLIRRETRYVTGVSPSLGGSGDPSEATAFGVLHAMHAVAEHVWGSPDLAGRHVCISGVGKVGSFLARHLAACDARLTVADVDAAAVERVSAETGAEVVAADAAHAVECDVFAPCALGGVLDRHTIPMLRCRAVVGSANNQLADPSCADLLASAGVVYAPDFVVNAGGIINIAEELVGYDRDRAYENVARIHETTARVLTDAEAAGTTTAAAADRLAEERIAAVSRVKLIRSSSQGGPQ